VQIVSHCRGRRRGAASLRRRGLLVGASAAGLISAAARGQELGRTYRLGPVVTVPLTDASIATVLDELGRLGFVQGKNLVVDTRGLSLLPDRMAAVARELAAAKVDLFLTGGPLATRAAQAASSTIPILAISDDMVGEGLVGSLANKGGNTTGISILATELNGKRQDILIELLPEVRHMAMLADATIADGERLTALQARARASGVDIDILSIARPDDLQPALEQAKAHGAAAVNILASPLLFANRQKIFAAAAALKLATMYQWIDGIREGAFAAYGPGLEETFRQRARQASKILRGVKAAELPVEPASMLQRADEVVE
jgi:putative tryptophan/tyrosine transport system substrate-binding protein